MMAMKPLATGPGAAPQQTEAPTGATTEPCKWETLKSKANEALQAGQHESEELEAQLAMARRLQQEEDATAGALFVVHAKCQQLEHDAAAHVQEVEAEVRAAESLYDTALRAVQQYTADDKAAAAAQDAVVTLIEGVQDTARAAKAAAIAGHKKQLRATSLFFGAEGCGGGEGEPAADGDNGVVRAAARVAQLRELAVLLTAAAGTGGEEGDDDGDASAAADAGIIDTLRTAQLRGLAPLIAQLAQGTELAERLAAIRSGFAGGGTYRARWHALKDLEAVVDAVAAAGNMQVDDAKAALVSALRFAKIKQGAVDEVEALTAQTDAALAAVDAELADTRRRAAAARAREHEADAELLRLEESAGRAGIAAAAAEAGEALARNAAAGFAAVGDANAAAAERDEAAVAAAEAQLAAIHAAHVEALEGLDATHAALVRELDAGTDLARVVAADGVDARVAAVEDDLRRATAYVAELHALSREVNDTTPQPAMPAGLADAAATVRAAAGIDMDALEKRVAAVVAPTRTAMEERIEALAVARYHDAEVAIERADSVISQQYRESDERTTNLEGLRAKLEVVKGVHAQRRV